MNAARLYYLSLDDADVGEEVKTHLMSALSSEKQVSLRRFVDQRDRDISLYAQHLLRRCVLDEGVESFFLKDVCYPQAAKPYWSESKNIALDFNISHSGGLIIAAASQAITLGVDVEKYRKLKNLNFKMVLSKDELDMVEDHPEVFFDLWSKKEAVVKAANTTGIARMRDVILGQDHAELDGKVWHLKQINEIKSDDDKYAINLATSEPVKELIIKKISLNELCHDN